MESFFVIGSLTKTKRTRTTKNGDLQTGYQFSGIRMDTGKFWVQSLYYSNKLQDIPTGNVVVEIEQRIAGQEWTDKDGQIKTYDKTHDHAGIPVVASSFQVMASIGMSGMSDSAQAKSVEKMDPEW